MNTHDKMPVGVGLNYHPFVHRHVIADAHGLDFVEIAAAQYVNPSQQRVLDRDGTRLTEIACKQRCTVRGGLLSIGSVEPLDSPLVSRVHALLEQAHGAILTEYLAFNRLGRLVLGSPQALPCCDTAARWVACRYRAIKRLIGSPFILEVTTYPYRAPSTEADFIKRVAEYTDSGLSLDIGALFTNFRNHRWDPLQFLRELPAARIAQVRITGVCEESGQWRRDSCGPVPDEIFDLLDATLALTDADTVVVERDGGYFPFAAVIAEVSRARQIFMRRREHIPARRHFSAGERATEIGDLPSDFGYLDGPLATLRDCQLRLIEQCLSAEADPAKLTASGACNTIAEIPVAKINAIASEIGNRAGHAAYLGDYFRQQQLVAWALRDAGVRRQQ